VDIRVLLDIFRLLVIISELNSQLDVLFMLHSDGGVKVIDDTLAKLIRADGHAEIVLSSQEHLFECLFNVVVELVHAHIQVLKLWILDGHPFLNIFSGLVLLRNLLNIINLRHCFLGLLRCLQLFVLFDDGVTLFDLSQLVLDLVFWEREFSNAIQYWQDLLVRKSQLGETKIFDGPIRCHHLSETFNHASRESTIRANVQHFDALIILKSRNNMANISIVESAGSHK